MTDYSHFEKLVEEHKNLNSLINNHRYGAINSIKQLEWMTSEFIDWVSPKYFEAFVKIYEDNRVDNIGAICAVIRENFLANKDTKEQVAKFLIPGLDRSISSLATFLEQITESKHNSIEYLQEFGIGINILTVTTFKSLESEVLLEKKERYSEILLAIADRFKNVSKMRDRINFDLYERVNTALKTLNLKGAAAERVANHEKRLGRKVVWYVIGTVLLIILLGLRFLSRLD